MSGKKLNKDYDAFKKNLKKKIHFDRIQKYQFKEVELKQPCP